MTDESKSNIAAWAAGIVIAIVVVPLALYALAWASVDYAASVAFGPDEEPGPMPIVGDWPRTLQELHAEIEDVPFDGYLLDGAAGEYSVKAALFRIAATNTELPHVASRLKLVAVGANHRLLSGWGDHIVSTVSKEWWAPTDSTQVNHYVSQPFLDGDEGELYIAAYDNFGQKLYLVYQYNF